LLLSLNIRLIEEDPMAATQKRVLVVDDALDIARLLRSALGAADPDLVISVFPSAEEAIFASAREPVHLLISDIRLPGISGADLVRRIRATNPGVKVILISGLNQEQIDAHINGITVDGLFNKPFEVTDFVELAQRCLQAVAQTAPLPEKQVIPAAVSLDLTERLQELQGSINADAAWLFNREGKYLYGAGAQPYGGMAGSWGRAASSALNVATTFDLLLDPPAQQRILTLRGGSQDLILATQGVHILVIFMPKNSSPVRMALVFEEIQNWLPGVDRVVHHFAAFPVVIQTPVETKSPEAELPQPGPVDQHVKDSEPETIEALKPEEEASLSELVSLLDQKAQSNAGEDADAFWESLADSSPDTAPEKTISFEEALRLGLAPNEDE
jgi:DNA-binding response OmpR family regulator